MERLLNFDFKEFKLEKGMVGASGEVMQKEPQILQAVEIWIEWVKSKHGPEMNLSHKMWKLYDLYYIQRVVIENSHWPRDIPIGYVFLSWVLSTDIQIWKLSEHVDAFNAWIKSNDNGPDMFRAYKKGQFYTDKSPKSNDLLVETDLMYGKIKEMFG